MSKAIYLKASFEFKETHLIKLFREESLSDLKKDIIQAFPLLKISKDKIVLDLKWQDVDNDWISLTTDDELIHAITKATNELLKIQVSVTVISDNDTPPVMSQLQTTVQVQHEPLLQPTCTMTCPKVQSLESLGQGSLDSLKGHDGPSSVDSVAHQPTDMDAYVSHDSLRSNTSDQYDGLSSLGSSSVFHTWPNEETCNLKRIQDVPLKRSPSVSMDNVYPVQGLSVRNRGRVVIINNKVFDTLAPLKGTDTDCTCISEVFKRLNFCVKPYTNKKNLEMVKALNDEYIHLCDYGSHYDVFILILLTRCEDNYIYGKDGVRDLQFWQILEGFNSIPAFQGKPKLFIAEGCRKRGENSELPADVFLRKVGQSSVPIGQQHSSVQPCNDQTDASPYSAEIEDTFLYCGNTYGSGGKHVKGSLMLQALKDALLQSAGDCSLQQMIPLAEEMIKSAISSSSPEFDMPKVVKNTLKKDLYFL